MCRPARPAPPFELEQRITGTSLVTDRDLVGKELTELRAAEGELDIDDVRGEPCAEAITLLEWQLLCSPQQAGESSSISHDYVPVADDGLLRYSSSWDGPVVDAWRKTLTPVDDLAATLWLRRVQRVLRNYPDGQVEQAYRDDHGRYVLVVRISLVRTRWGIEPVPRFRRRRTARAAAVGSPGMSSGSMMSGWSGSSSLRQRRAGR